MSLSGGRDQTFLPRTRAVLLDITVSMGFSSIPLPSTGKLPSTTAGELSPKSFSPDFPMASSAPDRENSALQLTEMPTPRSLSLFFLHSLPALHFSSAHLLLYFCQMITGCSISIFVLVLHRHKWPQVLPVPAPYHCLKGDLQTFRPGFAVTFYSTELSLLD